VKKQNENNTQAAECKNRTALSSELIGFKRKMVPKPSPTPFSAPFVSDFRVERNGNKLKIAQLKSLSTADCKKISNIEKIPDFFSTGHFFHKFRLSNALVN
jgi:hypothetical protein